MRTPSRLARLARLARIRSARRLSAGFTLIELMVVVVLIALLAVIAAPQMRRAREDRLAFDYARRIQQMVGRARTRAAGHGGAHLIVAGVGGGRGKVYLFEGLDNVSVPGASPNGSCKGSPGGVGQWSTVSAYFAAPTLAPNNLARIVDGLDLTTLGINAEADIRAVFRMGVPADVTPPLTDAIAMCVTGSGTTYAAGGTNIDDAINNMLAAAPFSGVAQIVISREGGVGLSRRVTMAGAAAPRIVSR